jgi:hypothetical protein
VMEITGEPRGQLQESAAAAPAPIFSIHSEEKSSVFVGRSKRQAQLFSWRLAYR